MGCIYFREHTFLNTVHFLLDMKVFILETSYFMTFYEMFLKHGNQFTILTYQIIC